MPIRVLAEPGGSRPSRSGAAILALFILVQAIDGAFTNFGVLRFGTAAEGNPLVASLIDGFGRGPGLAGAKLFAIGLGIVLYSLAVYRALTVLILFYLAAAILPWAATF